LNAGGASPAWLEVSVRLERRHVEAAETLLLGQGALAVTLTDHGDSPIWEPPVDETPLWETVRLTGLFPADTDREALLAVIALLPLVAEPETNDLADQVWERAWMDRFKPMRFGESLWIIPSGSEAPQPDGLLLHLDPGVAFGTGTHATTHLCLEWIDGQARAGGIEGRDVLDFGCGSGVLGIATALAGARHVRCLDYDPQAVWATGENARRNGVTDRVNAAEAATPKGFDGDIVIANILAGILQRLAPDLVSAVRPGGLLVLTGILEEQVDAMEAAYAAAGMRIMPAAGREGWVRMEGNKQ
jgi:ribosomal protein L11 methyltransferase